MKTSRGTRMILLIVIVAAIILLAGASLWYFSKQHNAVSLERWLAECKSFSNGSTQKVVETSRAFINLPKDIYPDINLRITSHGATAGYISNGGPYGNAIGAQGNPDCWSYYLEFDGTGTVDIASKSGIPAIPDYLVHFIVSSSDGTPE